MENIAIDNIVKSLTKQLNSYQRVNLEKKTLYKGTFRAEDLDISIPRNLGLKAKVGWAGTIVDILEERVNFLGWTGENTFNLEKVFNANELGVLSSQAHKDAFIYGTSFVIVGRPATPGGIPLISVESPERMTCTVDPLTKEITEALLLVDKCNAILFLQDVTLSLFRDSSNEDWEVLDSFKNPKSVCPVVQIVNNPSATDLGGHSEITSAIAYYVASASRTLLSMEVSREFFSLPQRYVLNVDEDSFTGSNGEIIDGWKALSSSMLAIPSNDDGSEVKLGQFDQISPGSHIEQIRTLVQLVAAEAGIPPSYLGVVTENPPSADSAQIHETRLVRRAQRRQSAFAWRWIDVAKLILLQRDGETPEGFDDLAVRWDSPVTSTPAADADMALKLVAAGIIPASSKYLLDKLRIPDTEQQIILQEQRKANSLALMTSLTSNASKVDELSTRNTDDVLEVTNG